MPLTVKRKTPLLWSKSFWHDYSHQPVTSNLRAAFRLHFWYLLYAAAARSRIWLSLSFKIQPSMALFSVYASGAINPVVHTNGDAPAVRNGVAKYDLLMQARMIASRWPSFFFWGRVESWKSMKPSCPT